MYHCIHDIWVQAVLKALVIVRVLQSPLVDILCLSVVRRVECAISSVSTP